MCPSYAEEVEKTPVREILAQNLGALMKKRLDLSTQQKLGKRAGIAQTSVSNMLRPDSEAMKSPKLDQVEKVARAFGLAVWQVLLDPKTVGKEMADMLMRPAIQDDDERLKGWDASGKARQAPSPQELADLVKKSGRKAVYKRHIDQQ